MMPFALSMILALACGDKETDTSAGDGGGTAGDGGGTAGDGGGTAGDGGGTAGDGGGTAGDGGGTAGDGGGTAGDGGTELVVITGSASVEANPDNPFSAIVTVQLDQDASVAVSYGQHALTHRTPAREVVAGEEARILVLGLVADTDWQLQVEAWQGESTWTSEALAHSTEPLPAGFPVCTPSFSAERSSFDPDEVVCTQGVTYSGQYLYFCTDYDGEPVHSMRSRSNDSMMSMRPLKGGGWASTSFTSSRVILFDEAGAQTAAFSPSYFSPDARFEHTFIDSHEMIQIDSGAWEGALAVLTATVESFPDGSYKLGNGLIVYDPLTDELLYDYSFHGELGDGEAMDEAVPYSSEGRGDYAEDWIHANTILHASDPDGREYLLLSLKSQDWIVKLYPDSDEIAWRLGNLGDFELVDDVDAASPSPLSALDWFYHQHGMVFVDEGDDNLHLLMFDNGYPRYDGRRYRYDLAYSRMLQVEVDEDAGQADLDWSYGSDNSRDPDWFFSSTCGNTVLLQGEDRVMALDGEGATMIEVSYPEGEERWRMQCETSEWCEYRVAWFPSLYELTWDRE